MDDAIISYIRRHYNLLIGESTAEKIKKQIGTVYINDEIEDQSIDIRGRDIINGIPKEITITGKHVAESLLDPINQIIDAIRVALECTPPELSSDIADKGIVVSGGGALIQNIDYVIKDATKLPVHIADQALSCVVLGIGKVLENFNQLKHVLFKQD